MHDELRGRERVYRLDTTPLAAVEAWLVALRTPPETAWSRRLDALDTEVHRARRDRRRADDDRSEEQTA